MNNRIRGIIFDPLLRGELKALVPDLTVDLAAGPVAAAALLSQDGEQFVLKWISFDLGCLTSGQ
jgi:hypothetical protein